MVVKSTDGHVTTYTMVWKLIDHTFTILVTIIHKTKDDKIRPEDLSFNFYYYKYTLPDFVKVNKIIVIIIILVNNFINIHRFN